MKALAVTFAVALASVVGRAGAADIVLGDDGGDKVKVQIKKTSTDPGAHKIQYSATDVDVVFTPGGGATDDPPTNGATAVIFSATDCQCVTMAPAPTVSPGWTQSPTSGTPTKYRWKDNATRNTAQVKGGKIKFKKKGGITYGLDATPQGEVEVQITFGDSATTFCTRFAAPAAADDTATKYKASLVKAGFGPVCSAVPGICPCAPTTTTTTSTTTSSTTITTSTTTSSSTTTTEAPTTTTTTSSTTTTTTLVCSPGSADCDLDPGNGCECGTPTCCGTACQTTHSNGLGQNYFDCMALGVPGNPATYNVTMANEARAAWPFVGTESNCTCVAPGNPQCIFKQTSTSCAVWIYTATLAGRVHLNGTNNTCFCATTSDPTWD